MTVTDVRVISTGKPTRPRSGVRWSPFARSMPRHSDRVVTATSSSDTHKTPSSTRVAHVRSSQKFRAPFTSYHLAIDGPHYF